MRRKRALRGSLRIVKTLAVFHAFSFLFVVMVCSDVMFSHLPTAPFDAKMRHPKMRKFSRCTSRCPRPLICKHWERTNEGVCSVFSYRSSDIVFLYLPRNLTTASLRSCHRTVISVSVTAIQFSRSSIDRSRESLKNKVFGKIFFLLTM